MPLLPIIPPCFWPGPTSYLTIPAPFSCPAVNCLFSCPAVICLFSSHAQSPRFCCSPETSPSPHTPPHCLPLAGCSLSLISAPNTSHPYYCLIYHQLYQSLLQPHPHPPHPTPPFTSTSTIPVSVRPHPVSPALNPASAPFETIAFVELANLPCLPQRAATSTLLILQAVCQRSPPNLPSLGRWRRTDRERLDFAQSLNTSTTTHNRPFLTRLVRIWMLRLSSPIFLCTSLINKR